MSAGYAFEVCLYCFLQIKETGAFVVGLLEACEKRICHFVSLYPLSYWFPLKKCVQYLQEAKAPLPASFMLP